MKTGLAPFEEVERQTAEVRKNLNIPDSIAIDFALNAQHAVNDLTRSIADLHPHKRSIAVLGAQPPVTGEVAKAFSKQGYVVQEITCDLTLDEKALKEGLLKALEGLKKDTLFILSADVEPITGLYYPVNLVRDDVRKKNIFLLTYQSATSLTQGLKISADTLEGNIADPYDGGNGLCLILKGARIVGEKLLWGTQKLDEQVLNQLSNNIKSAVVTFDSKTVQAFEKKLAEKFKGLIKTLPARAPRVFDRAVFFIKGVNGDALVFELKDAGLDITTADNCYWQDPRLNSWLPRLGFSIADAQESFAISAESMSKPQAFEHLCAAIEKLQRISGVK